MKKFFYALSIVFLFSFAARAETCEVKRGAMDFGSGTTKVIAAIVDICEKKILKVIFEERLPLALNEAMEKSHNKEIPFQVVESALPKIRDFVTKMKSLGVTEINGIATSVFRVAKNGSVTAQKISKEITVPIQVISQAREAELGYWSALAAKQATPSARLIVWDIGGGSMQMYSRNKDKTFIYEGDLASVTFKNQILQVLQFKDPKKVSSPNPIGVNRESAIQLAKNHAYVNVPKYFKDHAPSARWIGVGGVLSASVQRQARPGESEFTPSDLDSALKKRSLLKDEELAGDYRISDVSNLALVLGYMQALKIPKIETASASLGQGLLYYQLFH